MTGLTERVSIARYKYFLRNHMKQALLALPTAERRRSARRLAARLSRLPIFQRARVVGATLSLPHEMDSGPLLSLCRRANKTVVIPVVNPTRWTLRFARLNRGDLVRNVYGILEPAPGRRRFVAAPRLDLLLIPGRAFTPEGDRLGTGGGYYDRFCRKHPRIATLGVAYDEQILSQLPRSPVDRRLDAVLTPSRLYQRCNKSF
jgi:5-formyltetrahydrofolate cyclo-ligase